MTLPKGMTDKKLIKKWKACRSADVGGKKGFK